MTALTYEAFQKLVAEELQASRGDLREAIRLAYNEHGPNFDRLTDAVLSALTVGSPIPVEDEVTAPIDLEPDASRPGVSFDVRPDAATEIAGRRFWDKQPRSRYPLLIRPSDIGGRPPLDPIEARACRRVRASELVNRVPWELIRPSAFADPLEMFDAIAADLCSRLVGLPGAWVMNSPTSGGDVSPQECNPDSIEALAAVTGPVEFKAWCDRVMVVYAWVCEGDEP